MRTVIICVLLSAVAISADLQSDLDDIASHLPMEQMVLIGQKYIAVDPSFREGLRDMQTINYGQLFKDLLKYKETQDLLTYLNQHGVDTDVVLLHLADMMRAFHRKLPEQQSPGQIKSIEPEISGDFLGDCLRVISSSDIPTVIREKLETSPEFANLAAVVQDPEFKALVYRAVNSRVFEECTDCDVPKVRGIFGNIWKAIRRPKISLNVSFGR